MSAYPAPRGLLQAVAIFALLFGAVAEVQAFDATAGVSLGTSRANVARRRGRPIDVRSSEACVLQAHCGGTGRRGIASSQDVGGSPEGGHAVLLQQSAADGSRIASIKRRRLEGLKGGLKSALAGGGRRALVLSQEAPAQSERRWAAHPAKGPVSELVRKLAPHYRLNPDLVLAVIEAESNFNPNAHSPKDAQGLMQLIPETAVRFGVDDVWDPEQNLRGGMAYLRWLLDHFGGDTRLALAGYNAGEHAVHRHGGVPPYGETQAYVSRISSRLGM